MNTGAAENAGVAGNARLTAISGMALLLLCVGEVVTVILGAARVLTAHVVIGLVLAPVALVKIGSTGWRIVRYYRGDRAYTARGAPATYLRVLGTLLIALTIALLGSGILTFAGPSGLYHTALTAHKVSSYPWVAVLTLHTFAHFAQALQLALADLLARSRSRLAGCTARRCVVLGALVTGTVLSLALYRHSGDYLQGRETGHRTGPAPESGQQEMGVPALGLPPHPGRAVHSSHRSGTKTVSMMITLLCPLPSQ
jgi:hypothetical protein